MAVYLVFLRMWELDSNPRSPLGEEREYEISRQDREISEVVDASNPDNAEPAHILPQGWEDLDR
jgi:hypothetical protein